MTSEQMRQDPLFMRNSYAGVGKWGIPLIKKQEIPDGELRLIACSDTKNNDRVENCKCGVHFFVDDYRFTATYNNPTKSLSRYSQYAFVLSPDFSLYAEMNPWKQLEGVAHSRWVGAFWQEHGLTVIPTVSWSTASSFEFCFDGIERHSAVAVGMIGCKSERIGFLRGYQAMMERIQPDTVICFGEPFPEMWGNIVTVDYRDSRKVVR